MSNSNEMIKFKAKTLPIADFLQLIFDPVPASPIKLSIAELKKYVAESDDFSDADKFVNHLDEIKSFEEFRDFISNPTTQGAYVKDLLRICIEKYDLPLRNNDQSVFNSFLRPHCVIIFENIFDFSAGTSKSDTVENQQDTNAAEADNTKTQTMGEEIALNTNIKPVSVSPEQIRSLASRCERISAEKFGIDISTYKLTDKLSVTLQDKFYMRVPNHINLYHGCVAIEMNNDNQDISAIGHLQPYDDKMHICLDANDVNFALFREYSQCKVLVFPKSAETFFEQGNLHEYAGELYSIDCDIQFVPLTPTDRTLCIDFGTSNTTAGSYGIFNSEKNEIELVRFMDTNGKDKKSLKMLPTVVYVESCKKNPDTGLYDVKYKFGYEALGKVIEFDYNPKATVFYEIKRWVNDLEKEEAITDEQGNNAAVTHSEIIKAYLEHVINHAEQYFKVHFPKIHFTTPVKLKDTFLASLGKLVGTEDRSITQPAISIDEGIAIIYNHVSKRIDREDFKDKESVLIMDCGGGTTDLASCTYSLDTSGYSKKLCIRTKFEDGDSNFGGNNVTYRILQLLKIKLAHKLEHQNDPDPDAQKISVQDIMDDENTILINIDDNIDNLAKAKDDVYLKFTESYEKANDFVPTQFAKSEMRLEKTQMRRNFYYLWQMAEAYKVAFYKAQSKIVSVDFDKDEEREIGVPDLSHYYLYVREGNDPLKRLDNPMQGIRITNVELRMLLFADIYALLNSVFNNYKDNLGNLDNFDYYKLSGQSCTISLFHELLKEFIPGKKLRPSSRNSETKESSDRKMECIEGSIRYMRDKDYGSIKPELIMEQPKLIYDVFRLNADDTEIKPAMLSAANHPALHVLPSTTTKAKFVVKDKNGQLMSRVNFDFERSRARGRQITTNELQTEIRLKTYQQIINGKAIDEHIDEELAKVDPLKEGGPVFTLFLIPAQNGYGFYIYQILVELDDTDNNQRKYSLQKEPQYCCFEDETLVTFFDGHR